MHALHTATPSSEDNGDLSSVTQQHVGLSGPNAGIRGTPMQDPGMHGQDFKLGLHRRDQGLKTSRGRIE